MTQRPEAQTLVGMEESAIKPLERKANTYIAKRDARLEAGREEKKTKDALIDEMAKHGKTTYRRTLGDGYVLSIEITEEKKGVKASLVEAE